MFKLVLALCLLASLAAAPTDEKKTRPTVPNAYSMTEVVTRNTLLGFMGETTVKIWYDEGNLKREIETPGRAGKVIKVTQYVFKNYQGQGARAYVNNTGDCYAFNQGSNNDDAIFGNPLILPENAQFIKEYDVDGETVQQWHYTAATKTDVIVNVYLRVQEGVAVPVRYEVVKNSPPKGNSMFLSVIEIKDFSANKPDPSVFEIDTSKCRDNNPKRFFSGINNGFELARISSSSEQGFDENKDI